MHGSGCVPSSALLNRPLDELEEFDAAESDGEGEAGTEKEGDGGTWMLFLDEEESMLEDREGVRVRETITGGNPGT